MPLPNAPILPESGYSQTSAGIIAPTRPILAHARVPSHQQRVNPLASPFHSLHLHPAAVPPCRLGLLAACTALVMAGCASTAPVVTAARPSREAVERNATQRLQLQPAR